jgi:hypothetical protein
MGGFALLKSAALRSIHILESEGLAEASGPPQNPTLAMLCSGR